LRLCPTALMQTESVPEENSCESVLDNLTLKMTLYIYIYIGSYLPNDQHNNREHFGLKNNCSIIVIIIIIIIIILHIYLKLRTVTTERSRMRTYAKLRTVQHVEAYCMELCLHCRFS
jgi:hypothetical protein